MEEFNLVNEQRNFVRSSKALLNQLRATFLRFDRENRIEDDIVTRNDIGDQFEEWDGFVEDLEEELEEFDEGDINEEDFNLSDDTPAEVRTLFEDALDDVRNTLNLMRILSDPEEASLVLSETSLNELELFISDIEPVTLSE